MSTSGEMPVFPNVPALVKPALDPSGVIAQCIAQCIGEIKSCYTDSQKRLTRLLADYRLIGDNLLRIQKLRANHDKGDFSRWLEDNMPFSRLTAYRYMDLAANWDKLDTTEGLSLGRALQVIKDKKRVVNQFTTTQIPQIPEKSKKDTVQTTRVVNQFTTTPKPLTPREEKAVSVIARGLQEYSLDEKKAIFQYLMGTLDTTPPMAG